MQGWDAKTAEWYAEKFGEYATNRMAIDALDDVRPSRILDVGCGTGAALRHASMRWPGASLVGVDPVPRMVEIAKQRLDGHPHAGSIEILVGSAERLPVDDKAFDLVLAFDSLDHWLDVRAGAREIARVLADQGHIVIVKDQGVPGHSDSTIDVLRAEVGFDLETTRRVDTEEVSFVMWVLKARQEGRAV